MLGKLIKYEWKGLRKPLLILWIVLLGITLATGILILTINPGYDDVAVGFSVLFTVASACLYYLGIIACSLGTMLIIAIRFYKTCYTDEGYLTHTLPVSTKQLVAAKTITSILCYLLTLLFVILTAVLLVGVLLTHLINIGEIQVSELSSLAFSEVNAAFKDEFGISFGGYFGFIGGYSLVGCICGVINLLGCISLGQLYTKHRILGAIIAYFVLNFITQIIAYLSMIPMYSKIFAAEFAGESISIFATMQPTLLIILISLIVIAIAMYFVNLHMMTKRLNLE